MKLKVSGINELHNDVKEMIFHFFKELLNVFQHALNDKTIMKTLVKSMAVRCNPFTILCNKVGHATSSNLLEDVMSSISRHCTSSHSPC